MLNKSKAQQDDDDSSEVEFVDPPTTLKHCHVKEESLSPPQRRPRPQATMGSRTSSNPIRLIESPLPGMPPAPAPSLPHLPLSLPPLWSSSPSPSPSSQCPLPSPSTLQWPSGMYACDMVDGFLKIDKIITANKENKRTEHVMDVVCQVFHCRMPPQTYHDARARWAIAPPLLLERVLKGGKTPEGLWVYLSSCVPLK
ncbi:unnamed protein product [Cyclocybe aegerita]|uniref:Uncharacterized protein n=1 Tax=Cyclocybe aegerita TaxID=1973307 RepID=A0A8S0VT54_CYCAE|nr:unnamed protein product [Cyclocybe aegerita]